MENLIEPNLHPLIVHFTIAFLITGPVLLLVSSFTDENRSWRESIRITGDWMIALGLVSAVAALVAGFQAYYSVDHDAPSHLAMTDHRNWAIGTASLYLVFGAWRFRYRDQVPTKIFAILMMVPMLLIGVTGWKGGHLVYQYGLGVASLPQVSGDGHDHDHGDAHESEDTMPNTDDGGSADEKSDDHETLHDHDMPHSEGTKLDSHDPTELMNETEPTISEDAKSDPQEHDHSGHEH